MSNNPAPAIPGTLPLLGALGAPVQSPSGSTPFFFPGQFSARPALACLADLVLAQGVPTDAVSLAQQLGLALPGRMGVQDMVNLAEGLGFTVRLDRHMPGDLCQLTLPVLLFMADGSHGMQVLTQCDGQYAVTHSHASVVPTRSMLPVEMLVPAWARDGQGWVLSLGRCPINVV